jgi:hypothetical protein
MAHGNQPQLTGQIVSAPSDVGQLLGKWVSTAQAYAVAHRIEAIALKKRHTLTGAPSVVISAIVGTSIFAGIQEAAQSAGLKWSLALLSMTAAGLAALVTFYNYAERSTRHRIASEEYDDTARRLDILRTSISEMLPAEWRNALDGYSQRLEAIGKRVDLPESMTLTREEAIEVKGALPGGARTETTFVRYPKLPRDGFPDELERVFQLAQKTSH